VVINFFALAHLKKTGIKSNKRAQAILLIVCFLKALGSVGQFFDFVATSSSRFWKIFRQLTGGFPGRTDDFRVRFLVTSSLTFENCWWKG
jgi:hypothetical protein